jgi:hypothetical protein
MAHIFVKTEGKKKEKKKKRTQNLGNPNLFNCRSKLAKP